MQNPRHKKTAAQKKFKLYKNHRVTISRLYKERYFKNFFEENEKDSKKVGEAINAITNNNKNTKKIHIKNVITTDDKAIVIHFNKFFISVADTLIKKIPQTNRAYHDYLKNPNEKSLFMHPANPEEIKKIIKSLKVNKAIGPNSISPVTHLELQKGTL